jgi:hypothetical protein
MADNDLADALHGFTEYVMNERVRCYNEGVDAERERCAKLAHQFPEQILQMRDRPGGPPGNGYRPSTGKDIAAAIRSQTD